MREFYRLKQESFKPQGFLAPSPEHKEPWATPRANAAALCKTANREKRSRMQIAKRFAKQGKAKKQFNRSMLMTMRNKAAALAFAALAATAASSAAQAQVNTAPGGVTWNLAPSLTFTGGGINSIDLNSYSGTINGSSIMTFGSGDAAGQISFSGGSYSNTFSSGPLAGTRMVGALLGSATINFTTQQKFYAMNWGSVDTSNVLNFYNGSQLVYSTTGATALAGRQSISATNYYDAQFSFAEVGFTKVVLMETTPGRGFEVSNIAYSAEAVDVAPIPLNAASLGGLMSFLMMIFMRGKGGTQVMLRMAFASIMPRRRGTA